VHCPEDPNLHRGLSPLSKLQSELQELGVPDQATLLGVYWISSQPSDMSVRAGKGSAAGEPAVDIVAL